MWQFFAPAVFFRTRHDADADPGEHARIVLMGKRRWPCWSLPIGVAALLVAACGSGGEAAVGDAGGDDADPTAFACPVPPPTSCPTPAVRYADIAPTVQEHCVPCHMGAGDGPWPLTDYSHLADWQDLIQGVMMDCSMPPIEEPYALPARDRVAILTWVLCGFLE